jgi:tetratricopeptide (TPR) repeat protein
MTKDATHSSIAPSGRTAASARIRSLVGPWALLAVPVLALGPLCTGGCGGAAAQQERERQSVAKAASAAELTKRGETAASVGDMTRAEQYFAAALGAGGEEKFLVQRLLVVCVADERYPVAIKYADEYLERHPGDVDISFASASLHAAVSDWASARRLLEFVLRKRPNWSEAHFALATVLRAQDDSPGLADVHDLEYLKLSPNGPLAERARARLTGGTP